MIVARATDFESWRNRARELLEAGTPPEGVVWGDSIQSLLFAAGTDASRDISKVVSNASTGGQCVTETSGARVPSAFLANAAIACEHSDPTRFDTLYRLLYKISHGARNVLDDPLDVDALKLAEMLRGIRREEHRMHAFVRFRRVVMKDGSEHWVAWYCPEHPILARVAPFFVRRYPTMPFTLFTPDSSAHWDTHVLRLGPGAPRDCAPLPDDLDALFLTYYESVFNPARANAALMAKHIPARVRAQLPEGRVMLPLARAAGQRLASLQAPRVSASESLLPEARDLASLAAATCECRACPIGHQATQSVFGEGPGNAPLMIVGEQPGDEEDLAGRPFVGPAGRLLDTLMARAGLARNEAYVTNAVKHFKYEARGKRRLHSKPTQGEIEACKGWLLAEVAAVRPRMILCLGATAAQSFCGPGFRIQRDRGRPSRTPWAPWFLATYHPSALLRASEPDAPATMEAQMLSDLLLTRKELERGSAAP